MIKKPWFKTGNDKMRGILYYSTKLLIYEIIYPLLTVISKIPEIAYFNNTMLNTYNFYLFIRQFLWNYPPAKLFNEK